MPKFFTYIWLTLYLFKSVVEADELFYKDRIIFYVDNRVSNFEIEKDNKTVSINNLNTILMKENVLKIEKWLPMAKPTDRNGDVYLNRYFVIEFIESKENLYKLIQDILSLDQITSCEKIPIVRPAFIPDDELWDQLYGLPQVKAHLAYDLWDIEGGEVPGQMDEGQIVVAVPDIGLMWDHPDLVNNIWQNLGEDIDGDGRVLELIDNHWVFDPDDVNGIDDDDDGYTDNFVGYDPAFNDNDPYPVNSYHQHGTKVAGNISAVTNNGIGLASVGYSVKIMGVNANGNEAEPWYLTHTAPACLASAQMGADIINCSWVSGYYQALDDMHQVLYNEYGCIVLGAAGNGVNNGGLSDTSSFLPRYPAAFDNVISVTAMGSNNSFNCWANVHETVDISAPGENIICTMPFDNDNPERYAIGTGTSYATPLTAGAIALVKSVIPDASNEIIISKIIETTDDYPDMNGSCSGQSIEGLVGSGQLNIYRAILATREPELLVTNIEFQTSDGFVNPGDTVVIEFIIGNSPAFLDAEDVTVELINTDTSITILSGSIIYDDYFSAGYQTEGQLIIAISEHALLGNLNGEILIEANCEGRNYSNNISLNIPLNLNQYGYPINDINISQTATVADLDGNSLDEIYFSSENLMYGTWVAGFEVNGFPFTANSEISTVSAVGDINGNGDLELVFGTLGGTLYALTSSGTEYLVYEQPDSIKRSPALADINSDGILDIVFISVNANTSTLFVINGEGEDLNGFPVNISERIISGPAVADLENDSLLDIVLTTTQNNVLVIESNGIFREGFPYETSGSLKHSASIVDINNDQDLEILVGNENGDLYVINHNGSLIMTSSFAGGRFLSGISVADIDDNGQLELLFTSNLSDEYNNSMLYAYNPFNQSEIFGWPISMDGLSYSEPIITDLDNDIDLEVMISTSSGEIHIFHHDGSKYNNFPYTIEDDSILVSSSLGDLDNDGDYEIIIGTSNSLQVVDFQESKGNRISWNTQRANNYRNGYINLDLAELEAENNNIISNYSVSQNYPNPFNPTTHIKYYLPKNNLVNINIYDLIGKNIKFLVNEFQPAGNRSVSWDGTNNYGEIVSAGMYIYVVQSGEFKATKKMIFLK
jgi:serine protease